ncbi:hypothetical protein fugu_004081 [Takifugu bimaculatus]|uniref:Uncharacterized protein n=1 Tax=Takifugu bimaculatus TaxID=433685 RepID=A0A4Z2BDC7_9TELE|nr:hypothetical protein fugu_004081 [Takifugu bimaculatus]
MIVNLSSALNKQIQSTHSAHTHLGSETGTNPVPIIPTFLYTIDHPSPKAQNVHPTPTPRDIYTGPWSEETPHLVSLFDNTTFSVESWMEASPYPKPAAWTGLPTDPVNWTDSANSSCLQDSLFLEEENVRVGFLFASKALVQLLVNPFVGPLTNSFTDVYLAAFKDLSWGECNNVVVLLVLLWSSLVWRPSLPVFQSVEGTPLLTLLKDPYILISAGCLCFANMGVAILEPTLPIWMMQTMCSSKWQLGIFLLLLSSMFSFL